MDAEYAIVPQSSGAEGFIELARSKQGRLFEKHILNYGNLLYGNQTIKIDDSFVDTLIDNFNKGICDIVQVPKAGAHNEHTEDPDRNIGEVVGLSKRDNKVYALIDARSDKDAANLGKTLLGASAMMSLNYKDTNTGKKMGPTLLHVAVTNRPYVTNLEEYSEIMSLSGDSSYGEPVILTAAPEKENTKMTRDELFAELKADFDIDVPALQETASKAESAIALSNTLQEKLVGTGVIKLSNDDSEVSAEDVVSAISTLHDQNVELSNKVDSLIEADAKKSAEARVDDLIAKGFILPKKRDTFVALCLSDAETFESIVPDEPVVKLSNEEGADAGSEKDDAKNLADEIDRIAGSREATRYIRSK